MTMRTAMVTMTVTDSGSKFMTHTIKRKAIRIPTSLILTVTELTIMEITTETRRILLPTGTTLRKSTVSTNRWDLVMAKAKVALLVVMVEHLLCQPSVI